MAAKFILFIASAVLIKNAYSQCLNNGLYNNGIGLTSGIGLVNPGINTIGNVGLYGGVSAVGAGIGNVYNSALLGGIGSSGPLPVSTISPIGPSGLAVASENQIEGILQVSGTLPFLSAVSFEGALPTAGSGIATCGCGNGAVGIISEGFPRPYPGPFSGPLPGYATMGTGIGGIYY